MKVGVWNLYEELNHNNYMFLFPDAPIGDGLLKPLNLLYQCGKLDGVEFNTLDVCSIEEQDAFLFLDFPKLDYDYVHQVWKTDKPKYLAVFESELIRKENWLKLNLDIFKKIFTWHDDYVDNEKFIKTNFSFDLSDGYLATLPPLETQKPFFCTLISGNKRVNHPLELYSKREEAIRWFEKNHPEQFHLYGVGWDSYRFSGPKLIRALNRIKPLTKLLATNYPSYRGKVDRKIEVLSQYKYCICYENAKDIPGYITEKIFDCFFAGCVPIYWGASNVDSHIPSNCFIDKRKFATYELLYEYMTSLDGQQYKQYLLNARAFLSSQQAQAFSANVFAQTIIDYVSGN